MNEMYLNSGAHVRFLDGARGVLEKVVIDPLSRRVTDLVVHHGLLQSFAHVIPVSTVERASLNEIYMALRVEDLANYPQYREVEFEERLDDWDSELAHPRQKRLVWYPVAGIYEIESKVVPVVRRRVSKGIPANEGVIARGAMVRNIDGVVGKVDHLWLDRESWEITHIVVHRGIVPHYYLVPFSWITSITPSEILILGTQDQLMEVSAAQLHRLPSPRIHAEDVHKATPLDENLSVAEEVTAALAEDPRTASFVIEVVYDAGVVTLTGTVENEVAHLAAEEIAHRHERVVSVVNALEVRPEPDELVAALNEYGQLIVGAYGAVTRPTRKPTRI
jgi:hypothetical protein